MKFFYIQSGWKDGFVVARNKLHAIHVASETGIHTRGKAIVCLEVDERTLATNVIRLSDIGSGRVMLPSLFRKDPILLKCED